MEHIPCSWTGSVNNFKMSILPKVIHRFIKATMKIVMTFFAEIEKNHSKIYMESQESWNSQKILKKNKIIGLTLGFQNLPKSYSYQKSVILT